MNNQISLVPRLALGLALLLVTPAVAQQHRAVRLGNPATRFAPTLTTPEDLRSRFRDEKLRPDIAEILRQWEWKGNVADLHRAALTAPITEVKLPIGTRMPFMSSRERGKPVTLRDVLWAGDAPVEAYAFFFSSNGRRYRCVTPKPCSNFYLEDLGPEAPKLQAVLSAPAEASLCDAFEVRITVRNIGAVPVSRVQVTENLPASLKTADNQSTVNLDAGTLRPGEAKEFRIAMKASAAGTVTHQAGITTAEGATAEGAASTVVRAPALALECGAPAEVFAGQAADVCLTVRNTGNLAEAATTLTLPIPAGAKVGKITENGVAANGQVTWNIPSLAPGASKQVCAAVTSRQPGSLAFSPSARGACAPGGEARCETRVIGVPAILVEVVDLDDPIEIGKEATYVIKITNQGTAVGTNIRLLCTVPDLQEFVSGSGVTAVTAQGRTINIEPLAALNPKAEASWRIITKATQAGDARFKLEVTSDQFKRPIPEDESTTQY